MGFAGSFVVVRSSVDLDEISALSDRCQGGLVWSEQRPGGWEIGRYSGMELVNDSVAVLDDLVEQTGAPALTGFVLDSDATVVEAKAPGADLWRGILARWFIGEMGVDDSYFPDPDEAAALGVEWSRAASLVADEDALKSVFENEGGFVFAGSELFFDLVAALGIPQGEGEPAD